MWYVLDGEDASFTICHEKNILQAGSEISVNDKVRFVYRGDEYDGTVLFKSEFHEECNGKLSKLQKEAKEAKAKSKANAIANPVPLPPKRNSGKAQLSASNDSGSSKPKRKKNEPPKMTEAEKTRQRILALNKKESEKQANRLLIKKQDSKSSKKSSDDEWIPNDEDSQDSFVDMHQHKFQLKKSNNDLLKDLSISRSPSPRPGSATPRSRSPSPCHNLDHESASPSKEELMKQIELLTSKLKKKDSPTSQGKDKGSSNQINEDKSGSKQMNENSEKPTDKERIENTHKEESTTNNMKTEDSEGNSSFSREKSDDVIDLDIDKLNEDLLGHQLYGDQPHTTEIGMGIFCDKDILKAALANSQNVNHLIRRLMAGVFKPSQIMNCTVTGQPWHAGGAHKLQEKNDPLHPIALKAIVGFANSACKNKKLSTKKFEKCKSIFSVRLNEIKNQVKAGKLNDIQP